MACENSESIARYLLNTNISKLTGSGIYHSLVINYLIDHSLDEFATLQIQGPLTDKENENSTTLESAREEGNPPST